MNTRGTVSATGSLCVGATELTSFARDVFIRAGVPPDDAQSVARVLVWANLRGADSHGVIRIASYLDYLERGRMSRHPNIRVLRETPAILSIDADRAIGAVATIETMRRVIEKARRVGIGWAVMRNVTHQGALGFYATLAADAGMAGIVNTCGTPIMAPYGARAAGVHNSPIAICVPAAQHPPLLLDMAYSVAAGGKIKHAADAGLSIPSGWALDADGNATTDSQRASTLLPIGGPKGSGMAMLFECLSSLLAENPILSVAIAAMLGGAQRDHTQNGIVAAIDVEAFTDTSAFRVGVDQLIEAVKTLPRADTNTAIRVPGEIGYRTSCERMKSGIPLARGTAEKLSAIAKKLQIDFPDFV